MLNFHQVLKSSRAAIDLASIMVGIIVIGLIGGVIAASVFAVIPWSQDNAAKQQLDAISTAENAIYGLSSDANNQLKGSVGKSNYANSADLAANDVLQTGSMHCVVTTNNNKGYAAYAKSGSGKVFTITSESQKATPVSDTKTIPTDCNFLASSDGATKPVDTVTRFTFNCLYTLSSVSLPIAGVVEGTIVWNDGVTQKLSGSNYLAGGSRAMTRGVTYTAEFTGTFTKLDASKLSSDNANCVRSMDAWGADSGTTSASYGFSSMTNLKSVPKQIPATVTDMSYMFRYAVVFNDANLAEWDTSHVTNMNSMFYFAYKVNQPLGNWNTSNVTDMDYMFYNNNDMAQDISTWDVKKVTKYYMFSNSGKLPAAYYPKFGK
jgi:surface protein